MLSPPLSSSPSGDGARSASLRVGISSPDSDTIVVAPVGEADFCTAPELRRALHEAIDSGRPHVVVDLDQVTFMDASTVGLLLDARARLADAGGTLQIRCRSRHARRMFATTGLDDMSYGGS